MDNLIFKMFTDNWFGKSVTENIYTMRKQLYKNLKNQIDGYWSGSTAYHIMTKGGFLIDGKSSTKKELTEFGKMFMLDFENKGK